MKNLFSLWILVIATNAVASQFAGEFRLVGDCSYLNSFDQVKSVQITDVTIDGRPSIQINFSGDRFRQGETIDLNSGSSRKIRKSGGWLITMWKTTVRPDSVSSKVTQRLKGGARIRTDLSLVNHGEIMEFTKSLSSNEGSPILRHTCRMIRGPKLACELAVK